MKKIGHCLSFLMLVSAAMLFPVLSVRAGSIYTSPYVTFTSDRQAWTIDRALEEGTGQGEYPFWYDGADSFLTGITSTLRELREGEHYYSYSRMGSVPIGGWKLQYPHTRCIQGPDIWESGPVYHGIRYGTSHCGRPYYSGWLAVCADCGRSIPVLIYMGREAARSISVLDTDLEYYYLCPYPDCRHLEQGRKIGAHDCDAVSFNRYRVVYEGNGDAQYAVRGEMAPSFHMYDNHDVFEGNPITPARTLNLNSFSRQGYKFAGWNTEPDGTGISYRDGEEILNLTTKNYNIFSPWEGTVTLYAQWEKTQSALVFDAGGGRYNGENPVIREYGVSYMVDGAGANVTPPAGYTISFDTGGGGYLSPVTSTRTFLRWDMQEPVCGRLEGDVYTFYGQTGDADRMVAAYSLDSVILPTPVKENESFGGWYLDAALTKPAGYGGDPFTPAGDCTLYAGWVDLRLRSTDNYSDNDGKGAVDLSWVQRDNLDKTYKLYRSADGGNTYIRITGMEDSGFVQEGLNRDIGFEKSAGAAKLQTVTVPSSGFYFLTANGAQGGSCGFNMGGRGGSVSGRFYLKKGEVITFQVGGQDGTNGGGAASAYGVGGGMTLVSSDQKGVLLIAGGGGGATAYEAGRPGGIASNTVEGGRKGEDGMAGGGGGCLGGMAGEYIVHHHDSGCIRSVSTAAPAPFYDRMTHKTMYAYEIVPVKGHDYAQLGVHTTTEAGQASWYQFQIGDADTYFGLSGTGTLEMDVSFSDWGDDDLYFQGIDITVMSLFGEKIAQYTTEYDFVTGGFRESEIICRDDGDIYNRDVYTKQLSDDYFSGTGVYRPEVEHRHGAGDYHGIHRAIQLSGTFSVPIDEDMDGIYVICRTKYNIGRDASSGVWANTRISGVRYSSNGYICGYEEGQIVSSRPGYGGSNYINGRYAVAQSDLADIQDGNGSARMEGEVMGLSDGLELKGAAAPDTAAPDAVDPDRIRKEPLGDGAVLVCFDPVKDNGTEYYFKAESYSVLTGLRICISNVTKNLLLTGIEGYLYLVDGDGATQVTPDNAVNADSPLTEPAVAVSLAPYTQYLHIAALDRAGNLSDTVHVEIKKDDQVAWGISTEQIGISGMEGEKSRNIFPAGYDGTFYVRADGATPFVLSFASYLHGTAREDYQVNHQIFRLSAGEGRLQEYITILPYSVPVSSTDSLDAAKYVRQVQGGIILEDASYSGASRSNLAADLHFYQAFTISGAFHGQTITVVPAAGASFQDTVIYSDAAEDASHAVRLIADKEPPVITGLAEFQSLSLIDKNKGDIVLEVRARDELSGIRDFGLMIENSDNYCKEVYEPDEDGVIRVNITDDAPIFAGTFVVTGYAVDNVGNETREDWHVTEFALESRIRRILPPQDPVFKCGESGILSITAWGYADYVEVEFPDFLSDYNQSFVYTSDPEYKKEEEVQFMVPLNAPEGDGYEIIVRAYKGDKSLENHPSISTIRVGGTILDEIRTRLR